MTNPTNPVNKNTWAGAVPKLLWKASCSVAAPLQQASRWTLETVKEKGTQAWEKLGKPGEAQWDQYSPEEKTKIKTWGAAAGTLVAGVGTACVTDPYSLVGLAAGVTASSIALMVNPNPTANKVGKIAGSLAVGAGTGGLAAPLVGPMAAAVTGLAATSTAVIAANPGVSIVAQIPLSEALRFDTPNEGAKRVPEDPDLALNRLFAKVSEFRSNQPNGLFWIDPQIDFINSLTKPVLDAIRNDWYALGLNPSASAKIEAMNHILTSAGYEIPASNELAMSLMEKIEAIPTESKSYTEAKRKTDEQLELVVENCSIFTTLYFIHTNRLGFAQTDEVNQTFKKVLKEATTTLANGERPGLWSVYLKHMGHTLSFFQKIRAGFWYFLSHYIGVIPNTLTTFVKNIIVEFRSSVESTDKKKLNEVFSTSMAQLSVLLDIYNGANQSYIDDNGAKGNLSVYQKLAIGRLGDSPLLEKVKAELQPGDDLGKKMMKALCRELTHTLIDQCFPRVPFFERAKQWKVIGVVFVALDWVIGGIMNFFIRELTKMYLPGIVQTLVETGLDKTLPREFAFKVALADSLTALVTDFKKELANPGTNKAPALVENSIIKGAAERLLKTLKLKRLGENPTIEQVKIFNKYIETVNLQTPEDQELLKQLVMGAQVFIYTFSTMPEKMETLFGDILRLSNQAMQVGAPVQTEQDYLAALNRLLNVSKELIRKAVKDEVRDQLQGPNPITIGEYLQGKKDPFGRITAPGIFEIQKTKATRSFETLTSICQAMMANLARKNPHEGAALVQELDHYAETLKEFAWHADKIIEIKRYPTAVQHGFYTAFHSIYEEAEPLAQQAIYLQQPQMRYEKFMRLFAELELITTNPNQKTTDLTRRLEHIKAIGTSHNTEQIPYLREALPILHQHVVGIENAAMEAESERLLIEELGKLGEPRQFTELLKEDPMLGNKRVRMHVPETDQSTLFAHIRRLQEAPENKQRPAQTPILGQIREELKTILHKHIQLKEQHLKMMETSRVEFIRLTENIQAQIETARDRERVDIEQKLRVLSLSTEKLAAKVSQAKVHHIYNPMRPEGPIAVLPQLAVDAMNHVFGKPMVSSFEAYLDVTFDLLTSNDIYQGASRLFMGYMIRSYPKKGQSVASSTFQWIARRTLPEPVGEEN